MHLLSPLVLSLTIIGGVKAASSTSNSFIVKSNVSTNKQQLRKNGKKATNSSRHLLALITPTRRVCRTDNFAKSKKRICSPLFDQYPNKRQELLWASSASASTHSNNVFGSNTVLLSKQSSALSARGGGNDAVEDGNNDTTDKTRKIILSTIVSVAVLAAAFMNREAIAAFNFKEELAKGLDTLSSMGTKGLVAYIIAFMIWEVTVGVTTPVETAAGMAFGFKKAFLANAIGKTSGAIVAFLLGRSVLRDFIEKKLEGNEYMDLVKDSITKNPLRVALIWRFSFLPEQIKNFGLAVLPVQTWHFITAVLMHGLPFTLLWSFMGNEMGLVVRGVVDKPTKVLKVMIAGVYALGFFVSPSLVGLWVKGLRDEKAKREAGSK